MSKLSKIAKNMDIFANVMFWIFAVTSIGCMALPCGLVFLEEDVFKTLSTTISLGSVNLELANSVAPTSVIKEQIIFGLVLVSVVLGIFCYIIYYVRKILAPMKENKPFTSEVSNALKKLAYISLIGGAILEVLKAVLSITIYNGYDLSALLLNENISSISFRHTVNGYFILIFAVFYLLHFVFKYGEELQKESDETL